MEQKRQQEESRQETERFAKVRESEDESQAYTAQTEDLEQNRLEAQRKDVDVNGRHRFEMDVDRMVNEGLGGGHVGDGSGLIEESHVEGDSSVEE